MYQVSQCSLSALVVERTIINGARFDVSSEEPWSHGSGTVTLQQLDAVGLALKDTQALGSLLGLQSIQMGQKILVLWTQKLSRKEKSLLKDFYDIHQERLSNRLCTE